MRVLGRVRLSRLTDESTSIARQREVIEQWASANGHEVVAWAEDADVSRGVNPFDTPALGPWLTDEKAPEWDIVACWKLDRLATGSIYLAKVLEWCQDNDKILVSVTESLDMSTWVGRMVANVIAGVAEGEWEAIKERSRASHQALRRMGRWGGGMLPFGYVVERGDDGGAYLAPDPAEREVIWAMADMALEGASLREIATRCQETGVPPRRGTRWYPESVSRILRSRWVLGQMAHDPDWTEAEKEKRPFRPRVILGADGLPLQRAEPLLDERTWEAVQTALDERSKTKARSDGAGLLLDVAFCGTCGAKLYRRISRPPRGGEYRYWRCSNKSPRGDCPADNLPGEQLEAAVGEYLLEYIGDRERTERVYVPGDDSAEERARIDRAIAGVREEADLGLYDSDRAGYLERLKALTTRREALAATEGRAAGYEARSTGETYREAWERMDVAGRRKLLTDAGITVKATARPWSLEWDIPDLDRLPS